MPSPAWDIIPLLRRARIRPAFIRAAPRHPGTVRLCIETTRKKNAKARYTVYYALNADNVIQPGEVAELV